MVLVSGAPRTFLGSGLILIVLYQSIATASDQRSYPAPGQMVDVGGHRLHLLAMGAERGGPTVILESGVVEPSNQVGGIGSLDDTPVLVLTAGAG
jgi:hypothetical protein